MLNSVVNPNATGRPAAIAAAGRGPPVVTPEAMTAGSTGRMHGEMIVSIPARNPTASSSGLAIVASGYGLARDHTGRKVRQVPRATCGSQPAADPEPMGRRIRPHPRVAGL